MATLTFAERIADSAAALSPAARRVARYFLDNREEVLAASAAALAAKTETSDATVVRTAKALGFSGLDELRQALVDEIRTALSPADRLTRTLGEVGDSLSAAFTLTLDIHIHALKGLRRSISDDMFERAVDGIIDARRIAAFGLGPSSAIAGYLVTQLTRFGFEAWTLSNTGLLFADDLQKLREGDLVVMLAYGRVYAELAALLDEIDRRKLRSFLVTDTLAAALRRRVELVLPVARGRADLLSTHTATLGFLEAVLVGIATRRPDRTLAALRELNDARAKLAGRPMNLPMSG
jgi:DNA-binding MurR/RpiR family transcriptional regulator